MKNVRFYNSKAEYDNDEESWSYYIPNVCHINNYEGNMSRIIFHGNGGLGDILWVKSDDESVRIITHNVLNPNEGYIPIALRVITKNFLGNNEPSRWVSLKYMYFNNPATDTTGSRSFVENAKEGSITPIAMTWDETAAYTPKGVTKDGVTTYKYTQEQLNAARFKADNTNITYSYSNLSFTGTYPDDKFTDSGRISKTIKSSGYLPGDNYTLKLSNITAIVKPANLFYEDERRKWYSSLAANTTLLPSLYTEDNKWVVSENLTEFNNNILSLVHGKQATQKIVDTYSNAAPISGNTTYLGKPNFQTRFEELKPFYCCANYKTPGTNSGDWYFPSTGELAFIIANLKLIRKQLNELGTLYPQYSVKTFGDYTYQSANEYSSGVDWIQPKTGRIGRADAKCSVKYVLAYLQYDEPEIEMGEPMFDSVIEYLEFTGTQYIDTLFKGNTTTTKLNISLMLKSNSVTQALFGSRNTPNSADISSSNIFAINNNFRIDWAGANDKTKIPFSINTIYNIEITRGYFKINNSIHNYSNKTSINQNYNFLIGNFTNGSSTPFNTGLIGKVYSTKLYNNNELIMNLIPVRKGNVGYMYDKVSGQLFSNAGTGNFILGPDIFS